jgi:hypothetical protein
MRTEKRFYWIITTEDEALYIRYDDNQLTFSLVENIEKATLYQDVITAHNHIRWIQDIKQEKIEHNQFVTDTRDIYIPDQYEYKPLRICISYNKAE